MSSSEATASLMKSGRHAYFQSPNKINAKSGVLNVRKAKSNLNGKNCSCVSFIPVGSHKERSWSLLEQTKMEVR